MQLPTDVATVAARLIDAGHRAYVVGGAVRDHLLRRTVHDWDLATTARPGEVLDLFPRAVATGLRFGTVTVWEGATGVEVTTLRTEGAYTDGRHPDTVAFTRDIHGDLSRRDFTIGAMAYDVGTGALIDPLGGARDLEAGLIRAVGEPDQRFAEDGLRLLRAVRLAAELGFVIEPQTAAAIARQAHRLQGVAYERIGAELQRLLLSPHPDAGLRLLPELGLLPYVLPELVPAVGFDQRAPAHAYDVYEHSVRTVAAAPPRLPVRLAALLHDAAKPRCYTPGADGSARYPGHHRLGGELAREALVRLRFDRRTVERAVFLVRYHMFYSTDEGGERGARRLVVRFGSSAVADLADLIEADCAALGTATGTLEHVAILRRVVREARDARRELNLATLAVDGHDVMRELGLPPGPAVGAVLNELLEEVLADPRQNTRAHLLARLRARGE